MTNLKEKKTVTVTYFFIIMAVLAFSAVGCVGCKSRPMETKVVLTYSSMGAVIESALPTLKKLCEAKTLSDEECAEAKKAYNEAVAIYKFLGDVAIVAVDTGDDSSYKTMATRLMGLLSQLQSYGSN